MTAGGAWPISTVGEQFDVQLGKRLDAAVSRGTLKKCINNRSVRWGWIDLDEAVHAPLTPVDIGELRLVPGDVLVCEGGEIGRCAVWKGEIPEAYFLNTLHRLRPRTGYDSRFLAALFYRLVESGELAAIVGRATLAHLTKENLVRVPIPAPDLQEQSRIGDALDDADELIAGLERMIAKKQAIKQGMMQQLLTGRTRLPGFTAPWTTTRLGDVGVTYGGLTGKSKSDFGSGAAHFVTFLEVINSTRLLGVKLDSVRVSENERQNRVARGDILFNGSSETPEEVALSAAVDFEPGHDTYLNSFCFGFRLRVDSSVEPAYLAYFFRSSSGRALITSLAQGATRYNIAKAKFLDLRLGLPSQDEQARIVAILDAADAELTVLRSRLTKARAIKTGMMQQLLTGRTRLPAGTSS